MGHRLRMRRGCRTRQPDYDASKLYAADLYVVHAGLLLQHNWSLWPALCRHSACCRLRGTHEHAACQSPQLEHVEGKGVKELMGMDRTSLTYAWQALNQMAPPRLP